MAKTKRGTKPKITRVLSIDGGGIRGILPGQILVKLENILQKKTDNDQACIADYFDLLAGTSTGGILICLYLCPDDPEASKPRPRFSAKEAVELYLERGDEIFDVSLWQKVKSAGGLTDEKYSADELEEALEDYLQDLWLSDLLKPCLVTAYDIRRRRAHFFTQHTAKERNSRDFLIRDVARATSAAPTFFEVARVKSRSNVIYPLIDGGVFANNPALCAFAEARTQDYSKIGRARKPTASQMAILSLSTGAERKPYAYKEAKDWGKLGWVVPLIDILMAGVSDTVDYQLQQIYEAVDAPNQYLRIDPAIGDASKEMDDARPENLIALREAGNESAEDHAEELEDFADLLIANS